MLSRRQSAKSRPGALRNVFKLQRYGSHRMASSRIFHWPYRRAGGIAHKLGPLRKCRRSSVGRLESLDPSQIGFGDRLLIGQIGDDHSICTEPYRNFRTEPSAVVTVSDVPCGQHGLTVRHLVLEALAVADQGIDRFWAVWLRTGCGPDRSGFGPVSIPQPHSTRLHFGSRLGPPL